MQNWNLLSERANAIGGSKETGNLGGKRSTYSAIERELQVKWRDRYENELTLRSGRLRFAQRPLERERDGERTLCEVTEEKTRRGREEGNIAKEPSQISIFGVKAPNMFLLHTKGLKVYFSIVWIQIKTFIFKYNPAVIICAIASRILV